MLVVGVFFFLVAYHGFAISGANVLILAGSFIVAGLAIGCIETSQHTSMAALAPLDVLGLTFRLLAAVQSFGNIVV